MDDQAAVNTGSSEQKPKGALRFLKGANKTVDITVDVIMVVVLLIALYFLIDTVWVYMHSTGDVVMPYKPEDGNIGVLKDLSEDCVGWITLDDTSIDYPIMQGEDNLEYLNKDPFGEYSLAGSIFLDSRNASDFSDDYSILYGHHMTGGYMFGSLDKFEERKYFEEHTTGTLYTERGIFPIEVEAFLYTQATNDLIFEPDPDQTELESFIKKNADNYRDAGDGKIVALTTCKSPTSTRRACVFVRILEDEGSGGKITLDQLQELSDKANSSEDDLSDSGSQAERRNAS